MKYSKLRIIGLVLMVGMGIFLACKKSDIRFKSHWFETRVVRGKADSVSIELPMWMSNYPRLAEKFLWQLNFYNSHSPIPAELLTVEAKYQLLKNFGFDVLYRNLLADGNTLDSAAGILFNWWFYGVKLVLSLDKGADLVAKLLHKSFDQFRDSRMRILDLGCADTSPFPFLLHFFNQTEEILGIDISATQIDYAERNIVLWGLNSLQGREIKIKQGNILELDEIRGIQGNYSLISLFHPDQYLLNGEKLKSLFNGIKNHIGSDNVIMLMINMEEISTPEIQATIDKFRKAGFLEDMTFSTSIDPSHFALDSPDSRDLILVGGKGEIELLLKYLEE